VPDVMQLTLTSTSTALTAPAAAGYDAGFVANTGPTATVKSNRAWRLQISAAAATWTATNTQPGVNARPNKPAADLEWGTAVGGPFTALSVTPATAKSGSATAGTPTSILDRKSTRLNSSHEWISYAVFCLKKKKIQHGIKK